MSKILSKITLKAIGAQPAANSIEEKKLVSLAQFYGIISGKETKQSGFGNDYLVFHGNFEAVNLATGEIFRSGKLIVPSILESLLGPAVRDDSGTQFAVTMGAEYSAKGSTGYIYTVTPIVESSDADALTDLRQRANAALALPAPETPHDKKRAK